MSRTKPKVIFEDYDKKTHKVFEVAEAEATYAVYCDGKPIKVRITHKYVDGMHKYKRTNYPDKGRADGLAQKLNARFKTDKFTVHKLGAVEETL
jgi:hypothetical protein